MVGLRQMGTSVGSKHLQDIVCDSGWRTWDDERHVLDVREALDEQRDVDDGGGQRAHERRRSKEKRPPMSRKMGDLPLFPIQYKETI